MSGSGCEKHARTSRSVSHPSRPLRGKPAPGILSRFSRRLLVHRIGWKMPIQALMTGRISHSTATRVSKDKSYLAQGNDWIESLATHL